MFADRLKKIREELELKQTEVAKNLKIGVTTYNNYEKGIREPDFEMLKKIAEYLNVTTDYLLGLTNNPHESININEEYDAVITQAIDSNVSPKKLKEFIKILEKD